MRSLIALLTLLPSLALADTSCPAQPEEVLELGAFAREALAVERSQTASEAGDVDVCLIATWVAEDGTMLRQPLLTTTMPSKVEVTRSEEQIVVVSGALRTDPSGVTYTMHFTWNGAAQRFLPGEWSRTDPLEAALGTVGTLLADGDVVGARVAIARLSPDTVQDRGLAAAACLAARNARRGQVAARRRAHARRGHPGAGQPRPTASLVELGSGGPGGGSLL